MSDTVSNTITSGTGDCGNFIYTLVNSDDSTVGTPFIQVVDVLNSKALRVYTENADYAGEYTITMNVYLEDTPTLTTTFTFKVTLKAAADSTPETVSFPPFLSTDVSGTFNIEPGENWSLTLEADDADGDLADVFMTFSDSAGDWLDWNQSTMTVSTSDLGKQKLGTFGVTVQLTDLESNSANYAIVIEVACGGNNASELCAPEPAATDTAASNAATASITPTTGAGEFGATGTAGAAASILEEFLDYEVQTVVPIEDLVPELDLSLEEDEDFVDVKGVISLEQAAAIID